MNIIFSPNELSSIFLSKLHTPTKAWNKCVKHLLIIWLVTFDSFDILCSAQISTFESCKISGTNSEKYCGVCQMKVSCTDSLHLHICLGRYSSLFFSNFECDKHQISSFSTKLHFKIQKKFFRPILQNRYSVNQAWILAPDIGQSLARNRVMCD